MAVTDGFLDAQYSVLGSALIDKQLIPRLVSDLSEDDFTGSCRDVFCLIRDCFMAEDGIPDVVQIANYADDKSARKFLMELMDVTPSAAQYDAYVKIVRKRSKLYRLHGLGSELHDASNLENAEAVADRITAELVARTGNKFYGPEDLIASFRKRHMENLPRLPWPLEGMADEIPTRPGNMIAICTEPSGGKTAWGLQMMWDIALTEPTLFISLETDKDTLFDTWTAFISGISMGSLMQGKLDGDEWSRFDKSEAEIRKRKFEILPAAYMTPAGIKAAAVSKRAKVVIIDYLQIIKAPGGSRYEVVTEVSQALHGFAQETGITVIALCQVSRKDQTAQNAPLNLFSVRESSQISQDMDVMVMLDTYIDKELKEAGVKANRVVRVVKNKRGRKFDMPALFDGRFQRFSRVQLPNAELEKMKALGRKMKNKAPARCQMPEYQQLPIETEVPFT